MEDFMKKTSISFKTFLITATFMSPFVAEAGAKVQLQQLNNNMNARLSAMERDFANQDDNQGPTKLRADYKRRFGGQLDQLRKLLDQVTAAVNSGNMGPSGGRNVRRRMNADDLRVAPMITNAVANLDRLGGLKSVDEGTLQEAQAFLEGIQPNDQRLANQIDAALGILARG
jgi:hypothetical protein